MRLSAHLIRTTFSVAVVASLGLFSPLTTLAADDPEIEAGKKVAFDRKKGNCLACHEIAGGSLAGNIGPPLVAMKARYPDFNDLRAQIANPHAKNPNSIMPPFGPHSILSSDEINKIAKFIHTL